MNLVGQEIVDWICSRPAQILNMKIIAVIPQLKQEQLDNKVQTLEKEWSMVEEESLKNPSPGT
jgi:hypothetical protein